MTSRLNHILLNVSLGVASFLGVLGLAEVGLRALWPPSRSYTVLVPGAEWSVFPDSAAVRGVSGVSHSRASQEGIRGRPLGTDSTEYRILAVGGSTTQCAVLDDSEVWTHLLEVRLATTSRRATWVGNVGRSGLTTRHNVLHVKYLLQQYPGLDAVVAVVGVNDMAQAVAQGWSYRLPAPITNPGAEREALPRAFSRVPGTLTAPLINYGPGPVPWYKATALWQVARRAKQVWDSRRADVMGPAGLVRARAARALRPKVDSLPPLTEPLLEYRRNLNTMVDLAAAAGSRMVFVTHPTLWREDLPEREQSLMWFGWIGHDWLTAPAFYTPAALARAMTAYNDALLAVCRERHVECVHAARALREENDLFYDDVHFTERGSARLAEVLAGYFASHGSGSAVSSTVAGP